MLILDYIVKSREGAILFIIIGNLFIYCQFSYPLRPPSNSSGIFSHFSVWLRTGSNPADINWLNFNSLKDMIEILKANQKSLDKLFQLF